jgi:pyruvate dehydrogenase E2 component (dihydrolipoamide acetyltransferase)
MGSMTVAELVQVFMPKIGMHMMAGTLVEWLVGDGARVSEGEPLCVVETDKASHEIEAPASGYVLIDASAGVDYEVGMVLARISDSTMEHDRTSSFPVDDAPSVVGRRAADASGDAHYRADTSAAGRVRAAPAARQRARAAGVSLADVAGTGPDGLITAKDVDRHVAGLSGIAGQDRAQRWARGDSRRVRARLPLTGIRRAIAHNMMASLDSSAQVSSWFTVDAGELVNARRSVAEDQRPSYLAIVTAVISDVLTRHPVVNASLRDGEIVLWDDVNIGIAMAVDSPDIVGGGLVVPVIRHANTKSVTELAGEIADMARRAKTGRLNATELLDGTFTITSVGNFNGITWNGSTPILNNDEVAILWVGAVQDVPVVRDGEVVAGRQLPLVLTHDHRLVDGASAARFMADFATQLQHPTMVKTLIAANRLPSAPDAPADSYGVCDE